MQAPAPGKSEKVLITKVGTFLGRELASKLVKEDFEVYGSGKKEPQEELLESSKFTFLDLDLSQPFPSHIPEFNTIVYLFSQYQQPTEAKLSTVANKLIELSKMTATKVLFLTSIAASEKTANALESHSSQNLKLLAVGHIYGPGMSLYPKFTTNTHESYFENNELISLISQALQTDKVILNEEGLDIIYPTYIDDAVSAIVKVVKSDNSSRPVRAIASNPPLTALSASYEIQDKARTTLNKEPNLFFSGPESYEKPKPEAEVRIHSNLVSPKYTFSEGLEQTLGHFQKEGSVIRVEINQSREDKPILNMDKFERGNLIPEKNQKIKFKILLPKTYLPSSKIKKALFLALILFFGISLRALLNIRSGASDLKEASDALTIADFERALNKAQSASAHFSSAGKNANFLLYPLSFSNSISSFKQGIQSLEVGAQATTHFTQGAKHISQNLAYITSQSSAKNSLYIEEPTAELTKSYFESEYAKALAQNATNSPVFKSKFQKARDSFGLLSDLSLTAQEVTTAIPDITGSNTSKTYLVILMNNMELRPGGGFIGNFGEILFRENKLQEIKVEDVYTIDGQLKEIITPPPQLTEKLGVKQLFLRDSNWSGDFRVNAKTIRDFYKKETGKTVDGVIALDLTLVEKLLEKIGPVKLTDYNEDISSSNLLERGQYHSEVGFFPGSTQKRDFFSSLTNTLMAKILEGFASNSSQVGNAPVLAIFQTLSEGLREKHLMVSFDNENINTLVSSKGWDNPVPPVNYNPAENSLATKDFLALSEANIGANKVNRYLKRVVAYDMTIGRDADLMATLTLTYKNESPADTWPGGTYVNYLRILTPLNSSLEGYREDGKQIDLEQTIRGVKSSTVETTQAGELTQFAKLIEVPVKTTKTFTFKYRIPKNIKLELAPTYEFYISKQPGTLSDPFKFTFNLPTYLKIDSVDGSEEQKSKQNITMENELITDKHFQIRVSRK